jgi:CBS-domain-containing membrane protein
MIEAAAVPVVSFSIVLILATKTLYPPGGATALIAVIGGEDIQTCLSLCIRVWGWGLLLFWGGDFEQVHE